MQTSNNVHSCTFYHFGLITVIHNISMWLTCKCSIHHTNRWGIYRWANKCRVLSFDIVCFTFRSLASSSLTSQKENAIPGPYILVGIYTDKSLRYKAFGHLLIWTISFPRPTTKAGIFPFFPRLISRREHQGSNPSGWGLLSGTAWFLVFITLYFFLISWMLVHCAKVLPFDRMTHESLIYYGHHSAQMSIIGHMCTESLLYYVTNFGSNSYFANCSQLN